jgi:hypothetical protein
VDRNKQHDHNIHYVVRLIQSIIFLATLVTLTGWMLVAMSIALGELIVRFGVILFAVAFCIEVFLTGRTCFHIARHNVDYEWRVLLGLVETVPFLASRIAYPVFTAFEPEGFSASFNGIMIRAVTTALMEVIIVGIYVALGLLDVCSQ